MNQYVAYYITMIGASFWGLTGLFVQSLYDFGFSAWDIVAIRMTGASLILFTFLFLFSRKSLRIHRKHLLHFFGLGVVSITFFNWCYFVLMDRTSLSIAVVLLYTSPIFVMLLSRIFYGEMITRQKMLALTLTVVGCALAVQFLPFGGSSISWIDLLLGLASGFFCALYSVIGKQVSQHYSVLTITSYSLFAGTLVLFPTSQLWDDASRFLISEVWIYILGVIVVSTIFAYVLYTYGLSQIESSRAAILSTMEPIVAVLVGVFVFDDVLTFLQWLGVVLVIFSAFVTVFSKEHRRVKRISGTLAK
ncbi:DMT family transporter [Texcoconibacillus texcoconensis]|uniref:Drug/metabolite transporter (DMT)-like permease n=1 Tax=Texcoconibacillus texcoconensis TaxID=1095777 RepID=A0A840QME3_9BACI|nr:EamA family transporter [Texcoconibacillus texcoconensis]MBB5172537.1 drug/metabolite transporter (DMT)-like permease [Texcoconibacillus texcoconensis]